MNQPFPRFPIVYLVELMNPLTGELEETDVCAKLELAVEKVYWHLCEYPETPVEVEVSLDDDQVIEGVGFFDEEHEMLACVTAYHLDRDTANAQVPDIAVACRGDKFELQKKLNRIFRN